MVAPTASKRASVCTSPLAIRIIKSQPQTANKGKQNTHMLRFYNNTLPRHFFFTV